MICVLWHFRGLNFACLFKSIFLAVKSPLSMYVVHRADRHIQFRVICKDLIRGLPLLNQWRYNPVFLMELVLGHIYSRTRRYQQFTIFSVSSTAIVIVFMCNSAVIYLFRAAIANIWRFVQSFTSFFFKVLAGLITCRT